MLDEYNTVTNGSAAKTLMVNFITVLQVNYRIHQYSNQNDIQENFPVLLDYQTEIPDVKEAAKGKHTCLNQDSSCVIVNWSALRFEIQRLRNECNFLLYQIDQMRRQNANDKFPSKMKEYLTKGPQAIFLYIEQALTLI